MLKFLRSFALAALLLLPLASQTQTDCTSLTIPYAENFDAYSGNATSTSAPSGYPAITLPDCWDFLNMSASTSTYPQVFLTSSTSYAVSGNCLFFKSSSSTSLYAVMPAITYSGALQLSFTYRNEGTTASNGTIIVGIITDITDADSFTALDTCDRTTTKTAMDILVPAGSLVSGARLAFKYQGGSSNNYYAAIDNVMLDLVPTCIKVTNLAASNITANSITLSWTDASNTGATYIVYNMADTSVVASGISGTTYTANNLTPNTPYTLAVMTDCGGGDVSTFSIPVSARTACTAMGLPYTTSFEADEIVSTTNTDALPFCSQRYTSAATSGAYYPYSYSSSTYAHTGSRSLYFYGSTSSSYPDTMAWIMPAVDVTTYPMNGNRLKFWGRSSSTSYDKKVYVCTMSDPTDISTLTLIDSVTVTGTTNSLYTVPLTNANANAAYVVLAVLKGSGSLYMDDVTLEEMPSCIEVSNITVTDVTSSSVTLNWTDASNSGATYTIYNMADNSIVASNISGLTYTVNNLTPNTLYTFGVQANCSAGNATITTTSARTGCVAYTTPFTWTFEDDATSQAPSCWTKVGSGSANVLNSTSNSHGGSQYLRFSGASSNLILLPETVDDIADLQLSFWTRPESFTNSSCGTFSVGYVTDPTDASTFVAVDTYSYNDFSAYDQMTVTFAGAPTGSRMALRHTPNSTSWYWYVDDVTITDAPSCLPASALAADNITETSAVITWNGIASSYNVYNMSDTTLVANVATTSYTISGLTAMTQYTYGVTAVCGNEESDFAVVTFNTACAAISLPFTEGFEANSATVECWTTDGPGTWTIGTGDYSSSTGAHIGSYNAMITHATTGDSTKLITPVLDNASDVTLTFWHVQRSWSGDIDNLRVYYRASETADWTLLQSYTSEVATWTEETISITGSVYQVAFEMKDAYGYGVAIDDISITTGGTTPTQVLTINMSVNDATMGTTTPVPGTYTYNDGDSVIFTAVPNTGYHFVSWNIDYSDYGMGVLPISDSITLVVPVEDSDLGTEFDIIATFAIDATACTAVAIPFTEDFEANSTTAACWTTSNTNSSTGINSGSAYSGSQAFRFYYSTNPPQYLISPELSGTTDGVNVSFMYKAQSTSYTETFHVGYSTTTNDTSAFTWGPEISTNMPTWLPYSGTMPAGTKYVAVKYTAYDQYYLFIDSVVFDNPPACMPVTALTVYATTANSVTLNWNGTATSYSIYNGSTLVADNITTTNYTISGLTASTGYTFGVVANCGTETSTMETIDARTDCGDGSCAIQIDGIDSYGDGWDGATITVSQNGFTLGTFTVVGSTNTVQYSVCSGIPVTFTWTGSTASTSYPDEISFEIKDGSGMVGYLLSDATNTANGVIYTMNDPCPSCVAPIVTLDSVTTTDAYISWTGNATSYSIYNGSTFVASTAANTYTFSGLTAGTAYTFGVVAICSADDSSAMATVSVTTEFDCSDITTLPYNYGFESGLACWTTVNGSADGVAWMTTNLAGMTNVAPHSGSQVASSWSWNSTAMHANAWLISPKFVLPTVAAGDSLTFSWWEVANANYADSYSVKISTTTNDTAAFTVTARPSTAAAGSWTQQTIDLTAYAGQSVYVAFHHVDYDMNYLLIDDVELFQGAYVPPVPDSLTVTVATMDATMGTTNPAPGTYQYAETETVQLTGVPNSGYHFVGWAYTTDGVNNDTLDADYITVQFPASLFMSTGSVTFTALFEAGNPDSTTVTYAVNDATMGTTNPAPGTYTIYVGNSVQAQAVANTGYHLDAWVLGIYDAQNTALQEDTIYAFDEDFTNPMNFGTVPQSFADYGYTITVTALFAEGTVEPQEFTLITAVNDSTMGTITPAPGTHTYVAGDSILFGFTAAEGYTIGSVDITMSIMDQTIMDTTLPALYAIAMAQEPLYADDFLGITMSLTVNFVADTNSNSDVFTLVTAVNNATMGTMTPAPGTHTYNAGDVINFTVTANEGYAFESATMSISYMGMTVQEQTVYDLEFTTEPLEIDEEMLGFTMTVTVNFKSTQGIENADEANIYAYSKNGNIVLNGAEGREVYVFDINGRNLHHTVKATATETYNVPATGVYLVKVIGGETIRVVVMR